MRKTIRYSVTGPELNSFVPLLHNLDFPSSDLIDNFKSVNKSGMQ